MFGRRGRSAAHRRRRFAVVSGILLTTVACDLPRVEVEAACTPGTAARDDTDVWTCNAAGRWERSIPVEDAVVLVERASINAAPLPARRSGPCPETREYRDPTAPGPPEQHLRALTTNGASCSCVGKRSWETGLAPDAARSIRAAMAAKEAEAVANYARFGVPAVGVPAADRTIWLRTTWRSFNEQACLRRTMGSWARLPGESRHELGIAVDIEDWEAQWSGQDDRILRAHGWCRTIPTEGWHYEYRPALDSVGLGGECLR